jgi:hypothetical protein
MEELIIEANIKKEEGPLRTAWEAAVVRARQRDRVQSTVTYRGSYWGADVGKGQQGRDMGGKGARGSLPSPVSRSPTVGLTDLPPSPRRLYGIRARSVSY